MRRLCPILALCLSCACAAAPASKTSPSVPAPGRAPYDAPSAAGRSRIDIAIEARAAREILESLARPRLDPSDVKVIEDLRPVKYAIQDSTRTVDVFERDFAAAFQPETRAAVFDFRSIRERREHWQVLLDGVLGRQADLILLAQKRASSLLPADAAVSVKLQVDFTFGLAGLEDSLVIRTPDGVEEMVIDFARALADTEGETLDGQISRLSRTIGGEAFRRAWNLYLEASPAWKRSDPQLGQPEPLLKAVAAAAPVGLFGIDENFFPLSAWLKDAMKRALDDLNRRAERLTQAKENLDERMELTAELRRPDFGRHVAAPIGAFLADAIAQDSGPAGLRTALEQGPRAFFVAYDRAAQRDKNLIPLAKPIRDGLK